MGTVGSFDLNLSAIGNTTNNATLVSEKVTGALRDQASLIGLGIAIALALTLIFGVIFLAMNFVPRLISKVKGLKGGR